MEDDSALRSCLVVQMTAMDHPEKEAKNGILVIGAGLAGLTLALALAKRAILSPVIEKRERITPSKWAILLYPQGMKIFDELGVLQEITCSRCL